MAKYRDVTVARVKSDFGQGRVFGAKEAVRLGMADRVESMSDTIARLAGRGTTGASRRAEAQRDLAAARYLG